jgi:hypothetical protein
MAYHIIPSLSNILNKTHGNIGLVCFQVVEIHAFVASWQQTPWPSFCMRESTAKHSYPFTPSRFRNVMHPTNSTHDFGNPHEEDLQHHGTVQVSHIAH